MYECVLAIRPKEHHPWTVRGLDAAHFLHLHRVDHADVVLSAYRDPQLLTVRTKEAFVGRTPDIDRAFDQVGLRVYQRHGVRADGDHIQGLMVGEKARAMNRNLARYQGVRAARTTIAR